MDEPIFTLNFPFCNTLKVSRDGKWTVVVVNGIVYVYNMDGTLAGRLSDYHPHNSSNNLQVWGDEAAYLDKNFHLRIFLLPDFSEIEPVDLSQWSVVSFTFNEVSFTFNEEWIVFQESNQLPLAMNRHHRNINLRLERRLPSGRPRR